MTGRTWLVAALALSLLFNIAALGAGLRLWHLRQDLRGAEAAIALPRDLQRDLVAALARHRADLAPALLAAQQARAAAVTAAMAQPFDRARAQAALDMLRHSLDQLMQAAEGVVLDRLAQRSGN
jgi:hypothetical protein